MAQQRESWSINKSQWVGVAISFVAILIVWQFVITPNTKEVFFPSPESVVGAGLNMLSDGELFRHIGMSLLRVAVGFAIGSVIAIPIGLLMGEVRIFRLTIEPYINFFRSIPPIAFISLAIIWLGIGEASKIFLIVYTTLFSVIINTYFGVTRIPQNRYRAAFCLGASRLQAFFFVTIPGAMPYILTGMRVAMGMSFMTIVAAEMLAADEGLGYLIYNARLFMQTEKIFLGIILLGLLGIVLDNVFRLLIRRFAGRFHV